METVAQALERHGAKETLSDMKCSKTNTEVGVCVCVCVCVYVRERERESHAIP